MHAEISRPDEASSCDGGQCLAGLRSSMGPGPRGETANSQARSRRGPGHFQQCE